MIKNLSCYSLGCLKVKGGTLRQRSIPAKPRFRSVPDVMVYPKFFSEGIIILCDKEGSYDRFMNLEGEWISPYIYENIIDFYRGMATIHKDGRYGYLNQNFL